MSEASKNFLSVAKSLAHQASQEIRQRMKNPGRTTEKADHSLVTEVDLVSDEIIRHGLAKAFPDHGIVTEETGLCGASGSEYIWMIDPLDGTKAFAKGIPGFCVMVGLLKAGKPHLGVIVDPLTGFSYEAVRGSGAYGDFAGSRQPLKVSTRNRFESMPLVVSTGFPETALNELLNKLPSPRLPPVNSVGIKVGLLVRQEADIYLNHHFVNYWDTCAPQVILEEAGGQFSKLDGSPLNYDLTAPFSHEAKTIASNGTRHHELIKLIADLGL